MVSCRLIAPFLLLFILTSSAAFPKGASGGGPGSSPRTPAFDVARQLDHLPADLEFEPGVIVVKFKLHTQSMLSKNAVALPSLSPSYAEFGVFRVTQMYPKHTAFLAKTGDEIALDRMYRIEFSADNNPLDVAKKFAGLPDVEYAEPEVIHYLSYQPNDSRFGEQYMHRVIKSPDAWDITTGSEDVVIAIVDSGVNWNHEDLKANIWVNPGEDTNSDGEFTPADINGVDDDGNGYIDDGIGIDFIGDGSAGGEYYDTDPQPTPSGNPHGTHVAGIAAGVGDNAKGIAGVAYTAKIMSVKCGTDVNSPRISRGYDGIVYAADNGAHIINCSWGGGGYLASQNERIEYAVSKGALVVAAAGNSGSEYISTPGAYPSVLCVANTNENDKVNASSTFGPWVDVSAPGTQILSCISANDSSYMAFTGTSMASPVVAGIAALVLSNNPGYTSLQVGEQIRVSAEDIDDLNPFYRQKIGKGRVNAHRALTISSPGIRLIDWSHTDAATGNGNGILEQGETFTVTMTWQNLLAPASNVFITLSSPNPRVTIENPDFHAGAMPAMGTVTNAAQPFIIHIADEYAPNDKIDLNYSITDGEYEDQGGVYVLQQPTYRDHDANKILVTLSNDGNIGYDDFNGMRGSGFVYDDTGDDLLFEGALMVAAHLGDYPFVLDVGRDETGYAQCSDFLGQSLYDMQTPGRIAAQQGYGHWNDESTPLNNRLNLDIKLKSYAFTAPEYENCIFLMYTIRNKYDLDYTGVHVGLFFDWDISHNAYSDFAGFDSLSRTGFTFDSSGGVSTHVGVAVLSHDSLTHYWALANGSRDDSTTIGIYNGFSKSEKLRALTSGIGSPSAGVSDVSNVISNGPYVLKAKDSLVVGFVLMAGYSTGEILETVPRARAKWDTLLYLSNTSIAGPSAALPRSLRITKLYPQPASFQHGGVLNLDVTARSAMTGAIEIVDVLGRTAHVATPQSLVPGQNSFSFPVGALSPGMYVVVIRSGAGTASQPFIVTR